MSAYCKHYWPRPLARDYQENGMTFEVTRPESYRTCMGCSIVTDATARFNQYNTNEPDVALLEEFDGISKKTTHSSNPSFTKQSQTVNQARDSHTTYWQLLNQLPLLKFMIYNIPLNENCPIFEGTHSCKSPSSVKVNIYPYFCLKHVLTLLNKLCNLYKFKIPCRDKNY